MKNYFEDATEKTVRALAQSDTVQVIFSATSHGDSILPDASGDIILPMNEKPAILRGMADAAGLYVRYHNPVIHRKYRPVGELSGPLFDFAEQIRCEAKGAIAFKGIQKNLKAYHAARFPDVSEERETALTDIIRLGLQQKWLGINPPKDLILRMQLFQSRLDKAGWSEITSENMDQESFAKWFRTLLVDLGLEPQDGNLTPESGDESDNAPSPQIKAEGEEKDDQSDSNDVTLETAGQGSGGEPSDQSADHEQSVEQAPLDESAGARSFNFGNGPLSDYGAYTNEFDEVIAAQDLCDKEEMLYLRSQLDRRTKDFRPLIARLANRLQRLLQAQQMRRWIFEQEDGYLDAARLTQLTIDPMYACPYKQEADSKFRGTVVSLLIDNSGSMRGRPMALAAMSAEIIAQTLERCGVKVEILGFTTVQWRGGQSLQKWLKAGKPESPGRLNDLRHVIYKSADTPYRRAHAWMGVLLKENILKENIDGEALLWAARRLLKRPEDRKILMVISDGAPVDDATLSANHGLYLEHHLTDVIEWIEKKLPIDLLAVGIGHDVTKYYSRALTIRSAEKLAEVMLQELEGLFDDKEIRKHAKQQAGKNKTRPPRRAAA